MRKKRKVDGIGHGFVACVVGVNKVSGVVLCAQFHWMSRIVRGGIEVDESIEYLRVANPLVEGAAHFFSLGPGAGIAVAVGHLRGGDDAHAMLMRLRGDLREPPLEPLEQVAVRLTVLRCGLDVVDAMKEDKITCAAPVENIPIHARERAGAVAIQQYAVAADPCVHYSENARFAHLAARGQALSKI